MERWDVLYRDMALQGRSLRCRIWIGVCVCLYTCVSVNRLCLWSAALGTKCLALQVCVLVVVEACEACCGGGYVTAVMIGCGGWRHECVLLKASVSLVPDDTHTIFCIQSTMYLVLNIASHTVQAIRRLTLGRVRTCQVRRAKSYK